MRRYDSNAVCVVPPFLACVVLTTAVLELRYDSGRNHELLGVVPLPQRLLLDFHLLVLVEKLVLLHRDFELLSLTPAYLSDALPLRGQGQFIRGQFRVLVQVDLDAVGCFCALFGTQAR